MKTAPTTCNASAPPANGHRGNCSSALASGSNCSPGCNTGYSLSGYTSCSSGVISRRGTCTRTYCDASAAPANGYRGNCGSMLLSGHTCQPSCRTNYDI